MKIFTRTVFILTLFYLAKALAACCFCDPSFPLVFDELTVANADNSGKEPQEVSASEVNKNAYAIKIRLSTQEVAWGSKLFMINPVYAFDCNCEEYGSMSEDITEIRVATLSDFDENHSSGDDATDLFSVFHNPTYYSVPDYVDKYLSYFGELDRGWEFSVDLLLMTPPARPGPHQFEIVVTLSDGRVLTAQTTPVILN